MVPRITRLVAVLRSPAMSEPPGKSTQGKPDYGIDAPGVVRNLFIVAAAGFALFLAARLGLWSGHIGPVEVAGSVVWPGLGCGLMGLWMLYDSKIGKLRERERLLDLVPWRGDETVLDVGCGRGLLLIGAAGRLTTGTAVGLDLWQAEDLTGNRPEATLENARLEGVGDRVEVQTGDMRKMPFADARFDTVVSNVAIHNVYESAGRIQTMGEIARVLKPGGRVVIHDIRHVDQYAAALSASGLVDVRRVGSVLARLILLVVTFGSLRPDIITARRPTS
jgi:arsenite methyltransferase